LGIEDRIVPIKYGHPATVNRMVCVNGELHKLPSNLKSIFTTQPPFSKPLFLAGVKEFFTTQKKCPDESIYDFVQRRFGSVNVTSVVNFSTIKLSTFLLVHKNLASKTCFYGDSNTNFALCANQKWK
jgi:oxygen-dependent protoporphyrinogen oxidase